MEVRNSPLDSLLTGTLGRKGGLVHHRYGRGDRREISLGCCSGNVPYIGMSSNLSGSGEEKVREMQEDGAGIA